jgi:hypothetical protein
LIDLIEDENGDQILPLPDDICKQLNIGVGTELDFIPQPDGSIIMKRKNELKVFAVETVSTFRHVYFVKAESAEHAMDEVVCNDGDVRNESQGYLNYFQSHLGEHIVRASEVDNAGMVELVRETEQPEMTLEKWETGNWLKNCVNVIDYTK